MAGLLTDKVVLVTGGGRGIGAASARLFAAEGAAVVLASRSSDEIAAVAETIEAIGGKASWQRADVSVGDEVSALISFVVSRHGRIDGAFACAGMGSGGSGSVLDIEEKDFDASFDANTRSAWLTVKHVSKAMIAAGKGGSIVTTSSIASTMTNTRGGIYAAAKHAVDRISTVAARELGPLGIRVNTIAPGATRTEMFARWEKSKPGITEEIARTTPLGRIGEASEIAEAAAWLLSDRASYVSGAFLLVDGARSV
ncbi:SDR family NAD(P)-dependent oxidoreductase [Mesorhizobium sp. CAU 1732]|uniref:SDR family NAD(P)-dependent oxidoreductase n=1 Tax=Mesorhizobium sp. CAU 1732 TaxID=3140358 RepID=UPI00326098D4